MKLQNLTVLVLLSVFTLLGGCASKDQRTALRPAKIIKKATSETAVVAHYFPKSGEREKFTTVGETLSKDPLSTPSLVAIPPITTLPVVEGSVIPTEDTPPLQTITPPKGLHEFGTPLPEEEVPAPAQKVPEEKTAPETTGSPTSSADAKPQIEKRIISVPFVKISPIAQEIGDLTYTFTSNEPGVIKNITEIRFEVQGGKPTRVVVTENASGKSVTCNLSRFVDENASVFVTLKVDVSDIRGEFLVYDEEGNGSRVNSEEGSCHVEELTPEEKVLVTAQLLEKRLLAEEERKIVAVVMPTQSFSDPEPFTMSRPSLLLPEGGGVPIPAETQQAEGPLPVPTAPWNSGETQIIAQASQEVVTPTHQPNLSP